MESIYVFSFIALTWNKNTYTKPPFFILELKKPYPYRLTWSIYLGNVLFLIKMVLGKY